MAAIRIIFHIWITKALVKPILIFVHCIFERPIEPPAQSLKVVDLTLILTPERKQEEEKVQFKHYIHPPRLKELHKE